MRTWCHILSVYVRTLQLKCSWSALTYYYIKYTSLRICCYGCFPIDSSQWANHGHISILVASHLAVLNFFKILTFFSTHQLVLITKFCQQKNNLHSKTMHLYHCTWCHSRIIISLQAMPGLLSKCHPMYGHYTMYGHYNYWILMVISCQQMGIEIPFLFYESRSTYTTVT